MALEESIIQELSHCHFCLQSFVQSKVIQPDSDYMGLGNKFYPDK